MIFNKIPSVLITLIATVVILIHAQYLLIPLIFALLLWFLVRKVKYVLDKVNFVKNRFPSWTKSLITSVIIFLILGLVSNTLSSSISDLAGSYEKYESNVESITTDINEMFHINLNELVKKHTGDLNIGMILSSVFISFTFIISNTFIIILYTLFIFLEEKYFSDKLLAIFTNKNQYLKVTGILEKIEKSIADYIGLKTLVSFVTGILSYIVLLIIGIDSPVFWASLIFLLNFIPTIGSLAGTVLPAIFSLLQFGEFTPCIMVLLFIGTIQVLVGNVLEPKLMGNSLNISTLVTIVALAFWGAIWGITGMILSVPITVIMVIVFSQFEGTRPIAIMLSEKGKV
jgi:AI-2 transport protein TqsA